MQDVQRVFHSHECSSQRLRVLSISDAVVNPSDHSTRELQSNSVRTTAPRFGMATNASLPATEDSATELIEDAAMECGFLFIPDAYYGDPSWGDPSWRFTCIEEQLDFTAQLQSACGGDLDEIAWQGQIMHRSGDDANDWYYLYIHWMHRAKMWEDWAAHLQIQMITASRWLQAGAQTTVSDQMMYYLAHQMKYRLYVTTQKLSDCRNPHRSSRVLVRTGTQAPYLERYLVEDIYEYLETLVFENLDKEGEQPGVPGRWGNGALAVQIVLCLSCATTQIKIIHRLTEHVAAMLFHDTGAIVLTQILHEGIIASDESVAVAAVELMEKSIGIVPHSTPEEIDTKLIHAFTHQAANHPVKLWVQLLTERFIERDSVSILLRAVKSNFETLENHQTGYRVILAILNATNSQNALIPRGDQLQTFQCEVFTLMENLVKEPTRLHITCMHKAGNFIVGSAVSVLPLDSPVPTRIAECVTRNFQDLALHLHGQWVVQSTLQAISKFEGWRDAVPPPWWRNRLEELGAAYLQCSASILELDEPYTENRYNILKNLVCGMFRKYKFTEANQQIVVRDREIREKHVRWKGDLSTMMSNAQRQCKARPNRMHQPSAERPAEKKYEWYRADSDQKVFSL